MVLKYCAVLVSDDRLLFFLIPKVEVFDKTKPLIKYLTQGFDSGTILNNGGQK